MERAASIYSNFAVEGLVNSDRKASVSIKRVDYMALYTSYLVEAVRRAAGNIGNIAWDVSFMWNNQNCGN